MITAKVVFKIYQLNNQIRISDAAKQSSKCYKAEFHSRFIPDISKSNGNNLLTLTNCLNITLKCSDKYHLHAARSISYHLFGQIFLVAFSCFQQLDCVLHQDIQKHHHIEKTYERKFESRYP